MIFSIKMNATLPLLGAERTIFLCVRVRVLHVDVFHVLNSIMNQQGVLLHDKTGWGFWSCLCVAMNTSQTDLHIFGS